MVEKSVPVADLSRAEGYYWRRIVLEPVVPVDVGC